MTINLLLNRKTPGKIGLITLDCTISEDHEYSNDVPSFPVEDGADISDHIRQSPEELTINGFITNSPVKYMDVVSVAQGIWTNDANKLKTENRVQTAFEKLLEYAGYAPSGELVKTGVKRNAAILDIYTGLRMYTDMCITHLKIPRDSATGEALNFTLSLRKVRFVSVEFMKILHVSDLNGRAHNATKQASNKVDKSRQVLGTTNNGEKVSLLRQALNMAEKFSAGAQ